MCTGFPVYPVCDEQGAKEFALGLFLDFAPDAC
jgi:hypothetical protein